MGAQSFFSIATTALTLVSGPVADFLSVMTSKAALAGLVAIALSGDAVVVVPPPLTAITVSGPPMISAAAAATR